jgi:hypothetical protein
VGPGTGPNDMEKRREVVSLHGLQLRALDRSARSQSLHRLCYPGSSATKGYSSHLNDQKCPVNIRPEMNAC